jgi:riboflavin biosynthesis pyrimidine reductase
MLRLWPDPGFEPLTDEQIIALYGRPPGPWLRVNFAASLDGAASVSGLSAGLSSPDDKRVFGILRMLCDALVVGAGTVRAEQYHALRLSPDRCAWRRDHGLAEYPTLVVVSHRLDLDPAQAAFSDAPVRPIVLTTTPRPSPLDAVADVVAAGDLAAAVGALRERGLHQLLSEGGPSLFGALTGAGLVSELCLTLSPLLAGAGAGRISAGAPFDPPAALSLRHVLRADSQLLLRYSR